MTSASEPLTLTDIEQQQADLEAQAERLREQEIEARRREHERQEKQRDADAATLLEEYDEQAAEVELSAAEERLRRTILEDPVYSAAIDLLAARIAHYQRVVDVIGAAHRLNQTAPAAPSVGSVDLLELLPKVINTEASNRAAAARGED